MPTPNAIKKSAAMIAAAQSAIFEHWIETGQGMLLVDVARTIGVSTDKLYNYTSKYQGQLPGCTPTLVRRNSYSKISPEIVIRERELIGLAPSVEYLRERIREMRQPDRHERSTG
jgi:hypothetical protein